MKNYGLKFNVVCTFIFAVLVLMISCKSNDYLIVENQSYEAYRPPGTVKIKENFYADERELGNIDYKEYQFWISEVYGRNSEEYREILPDTTVWTHQPATMMLSVIYHQFPGYDNYPLVGISLVQAEKYTDWRTERVAEMILINRNLIKPNPKATVKDYFTIERYRKGGFDWIISREDFLMAKYSIPTKSEWEYIAGIESEFENGIDSQSKYNKKVFKAFGSLQNTNDYHLSPVNINKEDKYRGGFELLTNPPRFFAKNIHGLYGMTGNVSELVKADNICKGGNWTMEIEGNEIEKDVIFDEPNCWTGFRNICTLELVKIES